MGAIPFAGAPPARLRGDASGDGKRELLDAVLILETLFLPGKPAPSCPDASDVNADGAVEISDPIRLLLFLFSRSAAPSPEGAACSS
jgi:hypothetical protein